MLRDEPGEDCAEKTTSNTGLRERKRERVESNELPAVMNLNWEVL